MQHPIIGVILVALGSVTLTIVALWAYRIVRRMPTCGHDDHPHLIAPTTRGELVVVCYRPHVVRDLQLRLGRWAQDQGHTSAYVPPFQHWPIDDRVAS